jgi:hypothetical protein
VTALLGGPGVACSAARVRRLAAGELAGEERARTEAHLAGCARCRGVARELEEERARLRQDLPFEDFAAGVAERLARTRRRPRPARLVGLALAAGLALFAGIPAVLQVVRDGGGRGAGHRLKGGAELALYVREGDVARALAPGEPVPAGAALRVGLAPAGRAFAAVALVDADGVVVLHAGEARPGVLPGAFEWTAAGDGALVLVLDDAPVDAAALADRLARGGAGAASPGGGAEVVVRPLRSAR